MDRFDLRGSSSQFSNANTYIRARPGRGAPFPLYIMLGGFLANADGPFPDQEPCRSILDRLFTFG